MHGYYKVCSVRMCVYKFKICCIYRKKVLYVRENIYREHEHRNQHHGVTVSCLSAIIPLSHETNSPCTLDSYIYTKSYI